MTTATFVPYNQFPEDLAKKVHNLASDTLKVALSNTAPDAADAVLADAAEIAAGNGYSAGGAAVTVTSCEQTAGSAALIVADVTVVTATGSVGPFRYAILYNDTPTSPADPLIGYLDYGSAVTLGASEALSLDLSAVTGVLAIAKA